MPKPSTIGRLTGICGRRASLVARELAEGGSKGCRWCAQKTRASRGAAG